jgi:hypothetical protein
MNNAEARPNPTATVVLASQTEPLSLSVPNLQTASE